MYTPHRLRRDVCISLSKFFEMFVQKNKKKWRSKKYKKKPFSDKTQLHIYETSGVSVRFVLLHATLTRFSNERNSFLQPLHDHDEFFTIDPIEWIMKISLHTLFLSYVCMYLYVPTQNYYAQYYVCMDAPLHVALKSSRFFFGKDQKHMIGT